MFKVKYKAPRLMWNPEKFSKALHENLRVQIRQAAREFVRAAIVNIPVDTGEARGTFLPIGRFLNIAIPISGNHPITSGKNPKNPDTGSSINKKLLFTFPSNQYGEYFQIDWQLFHFWFNDFFQHNYPNEQIPTPWKSIEAGRDAFILYMKTEAVRKLPKLKDFLEVIYLDETFGYDD